MAKKVKASYREEVLRCVIALLDSRGSGTAPPPMPYPPPPYPPGLLLPAPEVLVEYAKACVDALPETH